MTRENKSSVRRLAWFRGRLAAAATPRARLNVACEWLVAEAWRNSRLADAERAVLDAIGNIRGEVVTP